jgi:hypothetical protein
MARIGHKRSLAGASRNVRLQIRKRPFERISAVCNNLLVGRYALPSRSGFVESREAFVLLLDKDGLVWYRLVGCHREP